jgi:hypothetical protein
MNPSVICFLFLCWTDPSVVPDGAGGFVPFTNSRVMPDGSLRPYSPAIDGYPPGGYGPPPGYLPDGSYPSLAPMPEPPAAYYDPPPPGAYSNLGDMPPPGSFYGYDPPPPPVAHAPSRRHAAGKACYGPDGKFIGAGNEDCGHDPNPSSDTREWAEPQ